MGLVFLPFLKIVVVKEVKMEVVLKRLNVNSNDVTLNHDSPPFLIFLSKLCTLRERKYLDVHHEVKWSLLSSWMCK